LPHYDHPLTCYGCHRGAVLDALQQRNAKLRRAQWRAEAQAREQAREREPDGGGGEGMAGIGCSLAHDVVTGHVYVAGMRAGGPAALCGRMAVGDVLREVEGVAMVDMEAAAAQLVGAVGTCVWVGLEYAGRRQRVLMVRQPAAGAGAERLEGEAGIGLQLGWVHGSIAVAAVVEGGAAACGGYVREGDEILAVDGRRVGPGTDPRVVADWLRGPPGSRVVLEMRRRAGAGDEAFTAELIRWRELHGEEARARTDYLALAERALAETRPTPKDAEANARGVTTAAAARGAGSDGTWEGLPIETRGGTLDEGARGDDAALHASLPGKQST
jgi:hypothetical protein